MRVKSAEIEQFPVYEAKQNNTLEYMMTVFSAKRIKDDIENIVK